MYFPRSVGTGKLLTTGLGTTVTISSCLGAMTAATGLMPALPSFDGLKAIALRGGAAACCRSEWLMLRDPTPFMGEHGVIQRG